MRAPKSTPTSTNGLWNPIMELYWRGNREKVYASTVFGDQQPKETSHLSYSLVNKNSVRCKTFASLIFLFCSSSKYKLNNSIATFLLLKLLVHLTTFHVPQVGRSNYERLDHIAKYSISIHSTLFSLFRTLHIESFLRTCSMCELALC
jgi:hypothetical protein